MSTRHNTAGQPRRCPRFTPERPRYAADLYFVVAAGEEKIAGILSAAPYTTQADAEAMARQCLAQDPDTYHVFTFSLSAACSLLESAEGARLVNKFSPSLPLGQSGFPL